MNMRVLPTEQEQPKQQGESKPAEGGKNPPGYLGDLLEETRIFLPGTQIFAGFLITLPFTNRFGELTATQRNLYLVTFVLVLLALVCFISPAAYHRLARPIHNKQAYKVLATRFIIVGLVPFSISMVLAAYFIIDVVVGMRAAVVIALVIACPILLLWWLFPMLRVHDHVAADENDDE
jgi:hypothetical protein